MGHHYDFEFVLRSELEPGSPACKASIQTKTPTAHRQYIQHFKRLPRTDYIFWPKKCFHRLKHIFLKLTELLEHQIQMRKISLQKRSVNTCRRVNFCLLYVKQLNLHSTNHFVHTCKNVLSVFITNSHVFQQSQIFVPMSGTSKQHRKQLNHKTNLFWQVVIPLHQHFKT